MTSPDYTEHEAAHSTCNTEHEWGDGRELFYHVARPLGVPRELPVQNHPPYQVAHVSLTFVSMSIS